VLAYLRPVTKAGQVLHAKKLGFIHPSTGEKMEFEGPLPEYFENLLDILRKKAILGQK
jgi:23S rRNA pseudouridine1911/1915/1917 synthase